MEHPWCDLIYLTDIMAEFECDVFFPEFDKKLFEVQDRYVQSSLNVHLQMLTCSSSEEEHKTDEKASPRSRLLTTEGFYNWISSRVSESRKGTSGKNVSNHRSQLIIFCDLRQLCFYISEIAMATETTCRHSISFTNISLALEETVKLQVLIPTWQIWRRLRITRAQWHRLSRTLLNFPQTHQIAFLLLSI